MADRPQAGGPAPSLPSPSHQNGRIGVSAPRRHHGGLEATPGPGAPGPGGCSTRPRGQSLGSALSSRTTTSRKKRRSSLQEEPEDLMDLILECQGQRLDDQRASVSLLPDPGPAALCGACSTETPSLPSLDFYYMLIDYQSDRMEDQRCSLPDLDDLLVLPGDQENFLSLVQRVQSRRMDEQRASLHSNTDSAQHHPPHRD
ncbi:uncharacterized protein V6R79_022324 [Siganus canaliculatus]